MIRERLGTDWRADDAVVGAKEVVPVRNPGLSSLSVAGCRGDLTALVVVNDVDDLLKRERRQRE